jgi:hypothetical protein
MTFLIISIFRCCFYNKPTVKFIHISNYTKHCRKNYILSHPKHSTALQPNVFLTGTHRLLLTSKGRSTSCGANNCQGQLQTPQSVSVAYCPNLLQPFWYRHFYAHFVYMQTEKFGQLKIHINYRGEWINPLKNKDAGNVKIMYSQVELQQRRISCFAHNSCILSLHCIRWREAEWSWG